MDNNKAYESSSNGVNNESSFNVSASEGFNSESDLYQQEDTSCKHTFSNEAYEDNAEIKTFVENLSNRNETESNINDVQLSNLEGCVTINTESNSDQVAEQNSSDQMQITNADNVCGAFCFKPKWLQKYATPNWFLVLYCKLGIIQRIYFFYFISCLSTLEKRYGFSYKIGSNMLICSSVMPALLGIFIGYLGAIGHRTRVLAYAMLLHALCCFLMAVPYAVYGPLQDFDLMLQTRWYRTYIISEQVCNPNASSEKICDYDDGHQPAIGVVMILFFAIIVVSLTHVVYYAVGMSYLDDNSLKRNVTFYIGIFNANLMFGSLIGQELSSLCLNVFEDPSVDPGFGPEDHRWIGAWWIGFLAQGFLLLIFIIPLTWFPRQLPNQVQILRFHHRMNHTWKGRFKDLASAVNRLARNPIYLCVLCYTAISLVGYNGYYATLPTYISHQFHDNTLSSGFFKVCFIQVTLVIIGFLIWRFRPSSKCLIVGLVLSEIVIAISFLLLMLSKCPKEDMFNYGLLPDGTLNIQDECNANCQCTTDFHFPICDLGGKTRYFSSCYAGCSNFDEKTQVFYNCSCLEYNTGALTPQESISTENCNEKECEDQSLIHLLSLPAIQAINSVVRYIVIIILLRSVSTEDKSVALGGLLAMEGLFGLFPLLVVFKSIQKFACLIWDSSCGISEICLFYDTDKLNYILHGTSSALSLVSAFSLIIIYCMRSRISDLYKNDIPDIEEEPKADGESSNLGMFTKLLKQIHSFL